MFRFVLILALLPLLAIPLYARIVSVEPQNAIVLREQHSLDEDACPPSTIVSLPITLNGNTSTSASNYTLACPDFNPATGPDDIYALSLPCLTSVTVSLCGSGYDTVVEVRRGTNYFDCPGSYVVTCNDDACGVNGTRSSVGFTAEVGYYYFIIVSGYGGDSGPYSLVVTGQAFPPTNDNCSGSRLITELPYTDTGSTTCAINDYTPSCATSTAPDVIYTLQLPCAAWLKATTCGHPLMDAVLHVRSGGACPGATQIACNDDDPNCTNFQSTVRFFAEPNTPYYIIVDGWSSSSGYYVLNVISENRFACSGDYFLAFPVSVSGDTRCENDSVPQCSFGTSKEMVYFFGVQHCAIMTATLCGTDNSLFDPVMEVHTGAGCPGDSLIACADDGICDGVSSLSPTIVWQANPGYSYTILVNGYYGSEGPFVLTVSADSCPTAPPPPVTDLTLQAFTDIGVVQLNWSPVAGATAYNIYTTDISCPPGEPCHLLATTPGNSFSDDGSLGGSDRRRFYRVTALNGAGPSPAVSLPDKIVPAARVPRTPMDLQPPVPYDYTASAQKPRMP